MLTVNDLPPIPGKKEGYPWTEGSSPGNNAYSRSNLPKISIITPSYNQSKYIEETIRSVLLQGYPNLEYIIIDGGSTDETVEIIRKYDQYITYWVSEPDRGQTHALNKGIKKVTGEIFTFINSDDLLAANALYRVAEHFRSNPSTWALYGGHTEIDQWGNAIQSFKPHKKLSWKDLALGKTYQPQPGAFWRTSVFQKTGTFREDLHYFFDQEFFIRLLMHYKIESTEGPLAYARIHGDAKTQSSSLRWSQEMYTERFKLLKLAESHPLRRLMAYRYLRLNFLRSTIHIKEIDFSERLKNIFNYPIFLTSPLALKMLFRCDLKTKAEVNQS